MEALYSRGQDPPCLHAIPSSSVLEEQSDLGFSAGGILEILVQYLAPGDLCQCRLVCRQWRDLFKTLPMMLPQGRYQQLQEVMRAFPSAVSMSLSVTGKENPDEIYQELAAARCLRHLFLTGPYIGLPTSVAGQIQALADLQSLSLVSRTRYWSGRFYSAMRFLTNLTRLEIACDLEMALDAEPFVELQKIEDLRVDFLLLRNEDQQLMFPHLAQLTSLSIGGCLDCRHGNPAPLEDWSILMWFKKVESFSISYGDELKKIRDATNLYSIVKEMQHITAVNLSVFMIDPSFVSGSLSPLSGLRSVHIQSEFLDEGPQFVSSVFSSLAHITRLTLDCDSTGVLLNGLTGLVELHIPRKAKQWLDLKSSLPRMISLEKLTLGASWWNPLSFPKSALSNLHHLQEINLENVYESDEFRLG